MNGQCETAQQRKPHAPLGVNQRFLKARKIAGILEASRPLRGLRILEVGTGSGVIAHYLAGVVGAQGAVVALDVVDQRQISDGYEFHLVSDTALPFADRSFDVVITNHVIEHVGEYPQQIHHLSEIHRVLKDDGQVYFAVPNRWRVVEPHYRLAFLSWWPRSWRSPYLRFFGRGEEYDCLPLSSRQIREMAGAARFSAQDQTFAAMRWVLQLETPGLVQRLVLRLPSWALAPLMPFVPTFIFLFAKSVPAQS